MRPRLPDPPDHDILLLAIARLADFAEGERPLLVAPPRFTAPGWVERIGPDDAPQGRDYSLILALDLWSEAASPQDSLARLREALAPGGQLLVVQTNWPQRRGVVPHAAGGPIRSPDFYGFRAELTHCWPEASLALASLDGTLCLHPLPALGQARPAAPSTLTALAFLASDRPMPARTAPVPASLPRRADDLAEVSPAIARGARRKLAFVLDVPGWAYDNIVNHIAPHLAGRYEVSRFYINEYSDKPALLAALFLENRFDHIHFMWREAWFNAMRHPSLLHKLRAAHGLTPEQLAALFAAPVVTTTIYDHLFLTDDEIGQRQAALAMTDGFSTASQKLADIYAAQFSRAPDAVTADGVNTAFFASTGDSPGRRPGRLRVGWAGNSAWGADMAGVGHDPKGLHSILKPAIETLRDEGHDVVLELADRNLRQRNREEMRSYYTDEIDVLVCASTVEGTPNPVLEAMASGRAWVSTDVGIVREVAGPVQQSLILSERSVDAMTATLRRLLDEPDLLAAAEAENRAGAAGIDWVMRVADWTRLFATAESAHARGNGLLRGEILAAQQTALDELRPDIGAEWLPSRLPGPIAIPSRLASESRQVALQEWLDNALQEIANRDAWIEKLRARLAEVEEWAATLAARNQQLEAASILRSRPVRLARRALRRLGGQREG